MYNVVSLFSGCGGMDLGFRGGFDFHGHRYKRLPYRVVFANDNNRAACATYKANLGPEIICNDVVQAVKELPETADIVIGGFPCQDVSINGKRQAAEGSRTVLYRYMVNAIAELEPKAFVAENVKGLLQTNAFEFYTSMLDDFRAVGDYRVTATLVTAADYGVPQRRERIFIVGVRRPLRFEFPPQKARQVTTKEAIGDLEQREEDRATAHIWSRAALSPEQGSRKLRADRPSTTIRAEHHGNSQWHYALPRRISLREAARIQSFPDSFAFPSGMRETERQIGNAVPPVLGWHLAKTLAECLERG